MDNEASGLISKARDILSSLSKEKKAGDDFNIFSILERDRAEVRHSRLLAELLNPKGSHGHGLVFLKKFTRLINDIRNLNTVNTKTVLIDDDEMAGFHDNAVVETEQFHLVNGVKGYIDIVIETKDIAIVIENKIDARDQSEQLWRYVESKKESANKTIAVYLTPDGRSPSNDSIGNLGLENIVLLSYQEHIGVWLDECIGIAENDNVKIVLVQYQTLIEKITNKNNKRENVELSKLLLEDGNMATVIKLTNALSWAKATIEMEFFRELKESVVGELQNLGFEFYNGDDWSWSFDDSGIEWISDMRKPLAKNNDNGLNAIYFYKQIEKNKKLFLRFGVDKESCIWLDCFLSKNTPSVKDRVSRLPKKIKKEFTVLKEYCILLEGESFPHVNFSVEADFYIKTKDECKEIAQEIGKMAIDIVKGSDFKELLEQLEH